MEKLPERTDLAIVGGGFSGLGVACEAARRGYSVALFEKDEICRATSANSLRIIHGGLRYLQKFDFSRVVESLREQDYWLRAAPQFVSPLACFLPLKAMGLKSRYPLGAASFVYDQFSRLFCKHPNGARIAGKREVEQRLPILRGQVPYGALLWYDALLDDVAGFAKFIKQRANDDGALILEHAKVNEVSGGEGRLCLSVTQGGEARTLTARVVVNTSGPWQAEVKPQVAEAKRVLPRGLCKAYNIIINRQLDRYAAFGISADLGRVFFFVPRGDKTAVGTWYTPFEGNPDRLEPASGELADFLALLNKELPSLKLKPTDIEAVELGLLPMTRVGRAGPELYGSQKIAARGGFVDVMSTKLTTFRSQAVQVMNAAEPFFAKS